MKVVLGVTGSIAASLIPGWVVYLREIAAWEVQVVMTESATRFVSPTALTAVSGRPAVIGRRWMEEGRAIHKEVARDADVVAVSPCTLNTMAKLSAGIADDAVTLTAAFAPCPVVLFPAFSSDEVGRLWTKIHSGVVDAGYHVSASRVPARRLSDGGNTSGQGFPTIDVFQREVLRVIENHAPA